MNANRTTISKEIYTVKNPGHILIGDEMYLQHIHAGTAHKGMKDLILDLNIPKPRKCSLVFEEVDEIYEGYEHVGPMKSYIVKFCFSNNEKSLGIFQDDKYYPDDLKENRELGCDTASFDMTIGDRWNHFDTGADGYYGQALLHKGTLGGCVILVFDADMFDKDELKSELFYLFDIEEKEKNMQSLDDYEKE